MMFWRRRQKSIGFRLFWHDTVTSTNDLLMQMAMQGEKEGSVVIAECQTAGRGRFGRRWHSPKSKGLYFSLLLQPSNQDKDIGLVPIMAAVAIVRVLQRTYQLEPRIKWPNDILLSGRKVAGILCESKRCGSHLFAVVGIGINVAEPSDDCPPEVRNRMIALQSVCTKKVDKYELLQAILEEFNLVYALPADKLVARWNKACAHLNRELIIRQGSMLQRGCFRGIDHSGAGLLELPTRQTMMITAAEFSLQEEGECC